MQIDQGLFKLEMADHHAVLGVPMDADAKQVRKRYLKIARKLHPDSLAGASSEEKQQASEILSKLVNPAYEALSQEKNAVEHSILLKLKGQQLQQEPRLLALGVEQAKKLISSNNIDYDYGTLLKELNADQYESLDELVDVIGSISELNAVYVMRKGGNAIPASAAKKSSATVNPAEETPEDPDAGFIRPQRRRDMVIDSYVKRAKEFQYKGNFSRAVVELREAIKQYPSSAVCHSYLAEAYVKAKQDKMAGIHAKRALEIDAENKLATEVKKYVDAKEKRAAKKQNTESSQGSGGLFGSLFGGKKRK